MNRRKRYKIWLKQANFDLEAAKLSSSYGFYEWATYQAEQAVEKALKSVLVQAGQKAPRMHKLAVLFGYCNSVNSRFKNTKFNFKHIESFTFISRYPFLIPGQKNTPHEFITKEDARKALLEASDVLDKIEDILKTPIDVEKGAFQPLGISKEELEQRIKDVVASITKQFDTKKIILFGSYARSPLPKELTTMDLLIIADTDLSFIDRIRKARLATRGGVPTIEPLVYTPEEFDNLLKEAKEGFFDSVLSEGRVIYKKD